MKPIISQELRSEQDVVFVRQRARQLAGLLGFDEQDQVRVATAVSEIARNGFKYAGGARVEFQLEEDVPQQFVIRVRDKGPGIPHLGDVLDGRYSSPTGMGLGIVGSKRLMDRFDIATTPGKGTVVTLAKDLPKRAPLLTARRLSQVAEELAKRFPPDPYAELQEQNRELLRALDEVRELNRRLQSANLELEDTNRGVVALYAELDEKADHLKRADETKTRFLSNMTHEFRTPLNSMLSLSTILLDQADGPLNAEQMKQVSYIRRSAEDLSVLVNDLLDLSKVAAGKVVIRKTELRVEELFGTLRGMLKPLQAANPAVNLVFEDLAGGDPLQTDEGKVSQILRNLISNALKYTESGEIRVTARAAPGSAIAFAVSDTGIGIEPRDQERIFEEFIQIESRQQIRHRGTGLGLPLARKLALLLGGRIELQSTPGSGSTFTVTLPRVYHGPAEVSYETASPGPKIEARSRILVIDDDEIARYVLKDLLAEARPTILEASGALEGIELARTERPELIFLDLCMPGINGFEVLRLLKEQPETASIPVIIHTSMALSDQERDALRAQVLAILPKGSRDRSVAAVRGLLREAGLTAADPTRSEERRNA